MSSDSQGVQHYVGRFDGAESDDFHIVTSASLEGSEVQMWSGSADKGPVYTLTDASQSVAWQSEDPPTKRYRAVLEPVRPRTEENVPAGVDVDAWLKGCSTVPVPGFTTKLRFLVAPQKYWTRVELWVHPTTIGFVARHDATSILKNVGVSFVRLRLSGPCPCRAPWTSPTSWCL
jgi:hypothetical protein